MTGEVKPLEPGLHFVSTPIGNARDITLRALDALAGADVLAAEDTRTLRRLMEIHGIAPADRPLVAYHDHNGAAQRPRILKHLADGKSVAYASEAGTPVVADPGFQLARAAIEAGHQVTAAPGVSAAITALSLSGLPSDRFFFVGFPSGQSPKALSEFADVPATLIFYESPKRLLKLLSGLAAVMGEDRQAVVCRELTKKFEEVVRGTLGELKASFTDRTIKGEIVVLVDRAGKRDHDVADVDMLLRQALDRVSLKDAVAEVAAVTGLARRDVYQRALALDAEKKT